MDRRSFLGASLLALAPAPQAPKARSVRLDIRALEKARVLKAARALLGKAPVTVTASSSPRSAGGKHDFFSQADYWWPDPQNPKGPYIQRDGMSNPDNFLDHRHALLRLSVEVPALTAAWLLTKDRRYADHAAKHLRAWFVDPETLMNPHLLYSQAIMGKVTGRSIGVIDTLHLVEVARAATHLDGSPSLKGADAAGVKKWFGDYLTWMTTHPYGTEEREAKNNHGTCWLLQAAEFARYTGNAELTKSCRERFKTIILPNQFGADGSFPQEMRRTKPYGYSLFNIDVMAGVCQVLSTAEDNLWTLETADGRGMKKALGFIYPYILDKKTWPKAPDVMYWEHWPVRHPCLVFGGLALGRPEYLDLWKKLPADLTEYEIVRNYPLRQPVLWLA